MDGFCLIFFPMVSKNRKMSFLTTTVIGPPCSGKTALVSRYIDGTYPDPKTCLSTIEDRFVKKIRSDDGDFKYNIIDTNGTEEYRHILYQAIKSSNSIIIAMQYERVEFQNILRFRKIVNVTIKDLIKETKNENRQVRVILAFTKVPVCNGVFISTLDDEINELCKNNGINAWVKTSAKDNCGIETCFSYAFSYAREAMTKEMMGNMSYQIHITIHPLT